MSTEIISRADIKQALKGIGRPFFAKWIYDAFDNGYLDLMSEGLLIKNSITKPIEVVMYFEKRIPDEVLKNPKRVTGGDFGKNSSSREVAKRLAKKITGKEAISQKGDKTRRYGTFGHVMCAELFSGKLISYENLPGHQLDIFSNGYEYELIRQRLQHSKRKVSKKAFEKLLAKIGREKNSLMKIWKQSHLPIQSTTYRELIKDLAPIFKGHMTKIFDYGNGVGDNEDHYLSFLTVLTWVEVLFYYNKVGSFPLFSEIFVLENSADVGFGRIDILSVISINGVQPTDEQLEIIGKLSKREFKSVGVLIKALVSQFGSHLTLKITDWKFAVGDGVQGMKKQLNIIAADDATVNPLPKHSDQLDRYLSLSGVSHSLAEGFSRLDEVEKIWETETFSLIGELVYFFPDREPVIHSKNLSKEDIQRVFKDQVVSNFHSATVRSALRTTSNIAMKYVEQLLDNQTQQERIIIPGSQIQFAEGDMLLRKENPTISQIILKHYNPIFLDPVTKVFEIVGRDIRKDLEVHVDRLFEAIEKGSIIAESGFNRKTGGKICCPFHEEKTPSMSIPFDRKAHCFGCGITADYNLASIPEGVEIHSGKSIRYELEKLVIPDRHREIMAVAQDILHDCFKNSPAEKYLAVRRGLDPRISYHFFDAGYGDHRLIEGLLAGGFTLDEMLYYGILGLSTSRYAQNNSTVEVLKRFGYSIGDMLRDTSNAKGEIVKGLPYSILEHRLTYPLEVHKVINSIYGRSLDENCPKNSRHRKTRAKETGMLHGGLNISYAVESDRRFIMVSEAGLNAVTLVEMAKDIQAQTAVVGVNNYLLLELLAKSKADIIFSYDLDPPKWHKKRKIWSGETGQENTVKARDALVEYGYKGRMYTFTPGIAKAFPNYPYNDTNKFWFDFRMKINVLDYIEEIPKTYVNTMGGRCHEIIKQIDGRLITSV